MVLYIHDSNPTPSPREPRLQPLRRQHCSHKSLKSTLVPNWWDITNLTYTFFILSFITLLYPPPPPFPRLYLPSLFNTFPFIFIFLPKVKWDQPSKGAIDQNKEAIIQMMIMRNLSLIANQHLRNRLLVSKFVITWKLFCLTKKNKRL